MRRCGDELMSGSALILLALLAALPVTWCLRQMVVHILRRLEQAEGQSKPRFDFDAGSTILSQPIEGAQPNDARGGSGIALAWNLLVLIGLAALIVCSVISWGITFKAVTAMMLVFLLLALAAVDLRTGLLPDVLTKPGLILGLAINAGSVWTHWGAAVMGALAGYWLLWLFFQSYRIATKKEGMGYGDFKLFAMLGAWLGWESLLPILLVSALTAMSVAVIGMAMKKWTFQSSLPFGPFLAFGGILRLFEWF